MSITAPSTFPWADIWGQDEVVAAMQQAVAYPETLAHAWLITGPPGSGRSNLAYAFAAALISHASDDEAAMRQVMAGTHPDVSALRTEKVIITIAEARALVERSYFAPASGRYRVIIVEDADRMVERTSNVLLKALEEPPERTVWILCAPSDADLLPTIRSRVRTVRLREPDAAAVARLIVSRTGADSALAEQAARHSQRHIGMAQRLATDESARIRRDTTLREVLRVRGVNAAVEVASEILQAATADAAALTTERDEGERQALLRSMGLAEGQPVPPALRGQVTALNDEQKKRTTRSLRDGIDRVLTDMQSLFRDVLMVQFGRTGLTNVELSDPIEAIAMMWSVPRTLSVLDHVAETREALERNTSPLLALESLLVTVASGRKP